MKTLLIEASRSAYAPSDIGRTMTIDQLIDFLTELREFDGVAGDTPVFLRHDRGYTFGGITEIDFNLGSGKHGSNITDDDGSEEDEDDE